MVGAVAHKCSPACSIWCNSSTPRSGRIEHSSSGRIWLGGNMPLFTSGGGLSTGTDMSSPERQMEEAHANRPNFKGTSSIVRMWAVSMTVCTPSGSAQKAGTTSRTRRRSHVAVRWGGRNRPMGFWS